MGKNKIIGIIVSAVIVIGVGFGGYALSKYPGGDKKVTQDNVIQSNQVAATPEPAPAQSQAQVTKDNSQKVNTTANKAEVKKEETKTQVATNDKKEDVKQTTTTESKKDTTTTQKPVDTTTSSQVTLPAGATINEIVPNGNIIYSAEKYAVPANEVLQMVNGKYKGNQKEVFLTFDDGPSDTNTPKVLNILKQYGVHATFFVLGSELNSQASKNILKEEIMNGNAIGGHSYSHDYKILYPHNSVSVSAFMNEMDKTNNIMQSVLGKNFKTRIIRMPGGYMSRAYYHDKNLPALNSAFSNAGITSIDWTAESGDAEGKGYSVSQLVQNAKNESKGWDHVVLLMHDIKPKTVQALPQIIEYYKSQGYQFKVISNTGIN